MQQRPRCLGLDVGDKRIGIAISDLLGLTAAGLETLHRSNMANDVRAISEMAKRHGVVQIIVGLPSNMDGSLGEQAQKVQSFGKKLARATGLPIIYEDERLSTFTAIQTLTLLGVKTGHNRDLVDKQAAAVILQKYLDREFHSPEPPIA
ncbi:MAG: Holliday junction resolvase RuvX [Candidatus Obscuribacterales bacterium]|nr:Holliday junction resolvase RuvX [Candidatus Obscuribacterales bacterium]